MKLSEQKEKEAKNKKVPVNYLVMADLMNIGYSEMDAYTIAYPENTILSIGQSNSIRENIVKSSKFRNLLNLTGKIASDGLIPDDELIDKTKTAKLIMSAALRFPSDSKERIEGLMKYSDLMGYKREEAEDDPLDYISFFLPQKCSRCPLLAEYNKAHPRKPVSPVEMEAKTRKEG